MTYRTLAPVFLVTLICTHGLPASAAQTGDLPSFEDRRIEIHHVFTVGQETVKGEEQKDYAQFREQNVVVTKSGRIVVICQGRNKSTWSDRSGQDLVCKWSDDQGQTWSDAILIKTHGKQRLRTSATSRDGGLTWTTLSNCSDLKTVNCNGALLAVPHTRGHHGTALLCSVPVGPGRTHGTVYVSFDNGRTWPQSRVVVTEAFAYSSLVRLPHHAVGLFYEAHGHKNIRMARFSLEWLLQ